MQEACQTRYSHATERRRTSLSEVHRVRCSIHDMTANALVLADELQDGFPHIVNPIGQPQSGLQVASPSAWLFPDPAIVLAALHRTLGDEP